MEVARIRNTLVEEYEAMQRQELIDRINRVPFESEAADRGTAFNEVVDCLILGRNTEREDMEIVSLKEEGIIRVQFRNNVFDYPISLCREFAEYFKGAVPQVRTRGGFADLNTGPSYYTDT